MSTIFHKRMGPVLLLIGLCCGLNTTDWATGQEQEFQTLELVRTYQSEEEFRTAHPEFFIDQPPIVDTGDSIKFIVPETGVLLKQIKKTGEISYTKEENAYLSDARNTKPVVKRGKSYYIPDEGPFYLIVNEFEVEIDPGPVGEPEYHYSKRTLYNAQGEKILEMPSDTNLVHYAPNGQYFVAYYYGPEMVGQYTYFYTAKGELLRKQDTSSIRMRYSPDGEYLMLFGEKSFQLFTATGDLIFQGSHLDYVEKKWTLFDVFLSNDGAFFLLSTAKRAILVSRNGIKQWEIPSFIVTKSLFVLPKNIVVLYSINEVAQRSGTSEGFILRTISMETGEILDEITMVADCILTTHRISIKTGGKYDEYEIK